VLALHELGVDHLDLEPVDRAGLKTEDIAPFQGALVFNKQQQDLYSSEPAPVSFLGPKLFRTTLSFPANVPPGIYQVQVFELEDGYAKNVQRSVIVISKVGLEADLSYFLQQYPLRYAGIGILIAILSGYLASLMFPRE
jgi:uncharacterized protein (TIGR02186 family)